MKEPNRDRVTNATRVAAGGFMRALPFPLALVAALAAACATKPAPVPAPTPAPAATPRATAPTKPAGDYRRSLGVITAPGPGVSCFSGRAIEPGAQILVFEDGDLPVAKLRSTAATCPPERGGHGVDVALKARTVIEGKAGAVETIGIGVVSTGEGVRLLTKGRVDLDGDGKPERFAGCTSGEGVHLTIWSGPIGDSARLWHTYVYLGYDTEPTCSEAESTP
jgi:hypothetical protein